MLCVYAKSMFGILVETEVKIEELVIAFTSSLPYLDDSPLFPLFTLLRKFLLPLPCLVDAPEKSELSQSSPRIAPRTEST